MYIQIVANPYNHFSEVLKKRLTRLSDNKIRSDSQDVTESTTRMYTFWLFV